MLQSARMLKSEDRWNMVHNKTIIKSDSKGYNLSEGVNGSTSYIYTCESRKVT